MNLYQICFNRSIGNTDTGIVEYSINVISSDVESAINILRKKDAFVLRIVSIEIKAKNIGDVLVEDVK